MPKQHKTVKIIFSYNEYRKPFKPKIEYKPKISEYWEHMYQAMFRKWNK